jgi:exopolysaccharide production protein ExoQ
MNPDLALLLFSCGVAGLFYLDRGDAKGVTRALWLPTLWLMIIGSRPVSIWLGLAPPNPTPQQLMEGSPVDAAVFGVLLVAALTVLWRRREQVKPILKLAWPILLYFAYCGMSTLWSAYTDVSAKRWFKSWGDLAMALIIATEPDISAGLRRLFARVGFVLLPASVMLIKYFPNLGRNHDPHTGLEMNTGVTVNKNMLGVIAFVLALGIFWRLLLLLRDKTAPNRRRRLLAWTAAAGFAVWVLALSRSDTSIAAASLGAVLLLLISLPAFRKPAALHALVLAVLLAGATTYWLGGEADVTHAMGRKSNLTGRTVIWGAVLHVAADHPIFGAGFESFWLGTNLFRVWARLPRGVWVNESHDGYIEVYAQLGVVGAALIALLLLGAYRRAAAAFARDPALGALMPAAVVAVAVYNITEAGFRLMDPSWNLLLLAFAASAGIITTQAMGRQSASAPAPAAAPAELLAGERWRGAI